MKDSVKFEWNLRKYEYHNYEKNYRDSVGPYHTMWFGYPNLNVKVMTQSYRVDLNTFVSAAGGGLGLFLGFSIIDTCFYIYDLIFKTKCKKTSA